jgi:hypothetical protein
MGYTQFIRGGVTYSRCDECGYETDMMSMLPPGVGGHPKHSSNPAFHAAAAKGDASIAYKYTCGKCRKSWRSVKGTTGREDCPFCSNKGCFGHPDR